MSVDDEIEIKVRKAIGKENLDELNEAVSKLLQLKNISNYVDLLNDLLLVPFHYQHQYIAKILQALKTPSSVPFIVKVLESRFEEIPYTGSDSASMAKWFSWALYSIRTKEAFEVIKKHADSEDEGIREEMRYRLNKLNL